jgi:hypothetical protein
MKAKRIVGLVLIPVALGLALAVSMRHEEPIQVSGDLSKRDVADICRAVRRKISPPPILPDLSVSSLRAAPGALLRRFDKSNQRIYKVEGRTYGFAAVMTKSGKATAPMSRVFWGVFRGTNTWSVEFKEPFH